MATSTELSVHVEHGVVAVTMTVPAGVELLEVALRSSRNETLSRYGDRSPYAPADLSSAAERREPGREVWFPVVDVEVTPELAGVVSFDGDSGGPAATSTFVWNGMFYRQLRAVVPEVTIPHAELEHWENAVLVIGDAGVSGFWLRGRYPVTPGSVFTRSYRLLGSEWSGEVAASSVRQDGTMVELTRASAENADPMLVAGGDDTIGPVGVDPFEQRTDTLIPADTSAALEPERLHASVRASVEYLLRARNATAMSPTAGGLYQFYDLDAATYRSPHWMWAAAPAVRLLLDAPRAVGGLDRTVTQAAARSVVDAQLRFRITDPDSPVNGGMLNRFNPRPSCESGYQAYASPADAGFFAGWALLPMYEATADGKYLRAATELAGHYDRLTKEFPIVPMQWLVWEGQWSAGAIDEIGFGVELLAELYRVTGDDKFRDVGRRYIDQCLDKLGRPDGLWDRSWNHSTGERGETGRITRGLGWAAEGLLAADRLLPEGGYLEHAIRMADHLVDSQLPAGCWAFRFDQPADQAGITAKGTALWSVLLYQLHQRTGERRHLDAARSALAWCVTNQYAGPDPQAAGGLVGSSTASAVVYRRWQRVACAYGTAFAGLAALHELSLTE